MTTRERWLAAIHHQALDRFPFWAKLSDRYRAAQTPAGQSMTLPELHAYTRSEPPAFLGRGLRERHAPGYDLVRTSEPGGKKITRYITPQATLMARTASDPASGSEHPVEFPVKTAGDLEPLTRWYQSLTVTGDAADLAKARSQTKEIGEAAITCVEVGESGLMHFVEWLAGPENAHFLLHDHPAECQELFSAIHRLLLDRLHLLLAEHPADTIWFTENTSTTLISVDQYRRYDVPHLRAYARLTRAAGKPLILHMCGHLKLLLPDLAGLGASAFEAFTAPPLGSATFLDGRNACPEVCLIGGTHATLWLQPVESIIRYLQQRLAELPHHRGIIPSSAGMMPPACRAETIRTVATFLHAHPFRG